MSKHKEENEILAHMLSRKTAHIENIKAILQEIEKHADVISNIVVAYDVEKILEEEETFTFWEGNRNACIGLTDCLTEDIKEDQFLVRNISDTDSDADDFDEV